MKDAHSFFAGGAIALLMSSASALAMPASEAAPQMPAASRAAIVLAQAEESGEDPSEATPRRRRQQERQSEEPQAGQSGDESGEARPRRQRERQQEQRSEEPQAEQSGEDSGEARPRRQRERQQEQQSEQPQTGQSGEEPAETTPRRQRERQQEQQGEQPQTEQSGEQPAETTPRRQRERQQEQQAEQPQTEQSGEQPAETTPRRQRERQQEQQGEQPQTEQSGEQPAETAPREQQPGTETEQPSTDGPADQQPADGGQQAPDGQQRDGQRPSRSGEAAPDDGGRAPVLDSQKPAVGQQPPAEGPQQPDGTPQPTQDGTQPPAQGQQPPDQAAQPPAPAGPPPADDRAAQEAVQPREIVPVTQERGERRRERPSIGQRERPQGAEVLRRLGDRVILNFNNTTIVESDERERMGRGAREVYYEDLPRGRVREVVVRENGAQVITVRNRYGDVIRRSRITPEGREIVLVYAEEEDFDRGREWRDPGLDLPPMRLDIPEEEYILDAETVENPDAYYEFLSEPPVERVERLYSVDEVKRSARIRDKTRRIDLDTVTFEFGKADVPEDQVTKLEGVAQAMEKLLEQNPAETFLIEGHTDAVGSDEANLALSDRRAEAVATALSDVFGIPPENLSTQGYGEQYLKVRTQEPERENRRVAIRRITPLVAPVASAN